MAQKTSRKAHFCRSTRCAASAEANAQPRRWIGQVPPKACFPLGFWPDEFEFPSCNACNNGTAKHDTIFGFYSMLLDFNEDNRTPADRARLDKLRVEISRRYPEAMPDAASGAPIYQAGSIVTPSPVAYSVNSNAALKEAMRTIGEKLAHALYYREMKKIMTGDHQFFAEMYQLQKAGTEDLTALFKRLLPDLRIGGRPNIRKYGNRFAYISGCKPKEDLFLFAAQFGYGLVCWGMVLGPDMKLSETNDALAKMSWTPQVRAVLAAKVLAHLWCRMSRWRLRRILKPLTFHRQPKRHYDTCAPAGAARKHGPACAGKRRVLFCYRRRLGRMGNVVNYKTDALMKFITLVQNVEGCLQDSLVACNIHCTT